MAVPVLLVQKRFAPAPPPRGIAAALAAAAQHGNGGGLGGGANAGRGGDGYQNPAYVGGAGGAGDAAAAAADGAAGYLAVGAVGEEGGGAPLYRPVYAAAGGGGEGDGGGGAPMYRPVYAAAGGGGEEQDPTYSGYTAPEQQAAIIYAIPMEVEDGEDNATYYTADATPYYAPPTSQPANQQPVYDLAAGGGKQNAVYDAQATHDTEA